MSENLPPELEWEYVRIDMSQEVLSMDEETHIVHFLLAPDPRRYNQLETDGETVFEDKFMGHVFTLSDLNQMMQGVPGTPLYVPRRNFRNGSDYSRERRDALDEERGTGHYRAPATRPAKSRSLEVSGQIESMTFVSVDVVGSTLMRAEFGDAYDKAFNRMLRELIVSLGQFHGSVLKITGDGFIGFFDGPSINTQCDTAVDAAITLIHLLDDAINPAAREAGLPELNIRVGVDHGEARVVDHHIPDVDHSQKDVISDALNRAVKLQEAAETQSVLIGRALYERVHVGWLERSEPRAALSSIARAPYPTYRVW